MIFDFHTHVFDKPFNSLSVYTQRTVLPDDNLTKERVRPKENVKDFGMKLAKDINFTSQTHLDALKEGGFQCVCVALYPLEQVFTNFRTEGEMTKVAALLCKWVFGVKAIVKDLGIKLVATTSGYEFADVNRIFKGETSYFTKLKEQHRYVVDGQNDTNASVQYQIAKNNTEKNAIVNAGKIAVILSIEGITSCYGAFNFRQKLKDQRNRKLGPFLDQCIANVVEMKSLDPCPFIVTLAHHQYNFICGNALSFVGIPKAILKQNGQTNIESEGRNIWFPNIGITDIGFKIIKTLLDPSIGRRRVLVDTKHMSIKARREYHAYVKQQSDGIPIVQTHTAVSGRSFNEPKSWVKKNTTELKIRRQRKIGFNTGSINMFDEEIVDIVESDGLMGIMIDEKRLIGKTFMSDTMKLIDEMQISGTYTQYIASEFYSDYVTKDMEFEQLQKLLYQKTEMKNLLAKLSKAKIDKVRIVTSGDIVPNELKVKISDLKEQVAELRQILIPFEMSILLNQFFYILDKCSHLGNKAWDHICIGTDYDGVINSLDSLYYASDFKDFKFYLRKHWNIGIQRASNGEEEFNLYSKYLFDRTVDYYIDKILWGNSEVFLGKYF